MDNFCFTDMNVLMGWLLCGVSFIYLVFWLVCGFVHFVFKDFILLWETFGNDGYCVSLLLPIRVSLESLNLASRFH